MAHYAVLDENNIVINVFVGKNEDELYQDQPMDWEEYYKAKRTSYNTQANVHLNGGTPFRKNYAGIGYSYDPVRDAFIPPSPYPSWVLDEEKCIWVAPVPMLEGEGQNVYWDEPSISWKVMDPNEGSDQTL